MWSSNFSQHLIVLGIFYLFSPVLSWVWKCDTSTSFCKRYRDADDASYPSLEVCRLVCGKYGALWPRPTISTKLSDTLLQFNAQKVEYRINEKRETLFFLEQNVNIFHSHLSVTPNCPSQNRINVEISTSTDDLSLTWSTDESYDLDIQTEGTTTTVKITATTAFGARHGLETLSQLIALYKNNGNSECLVLINSAKIKDKPVYAHRGLLLDTARNFLPLPKIKKHVDAMAASKLNVLHWHVTDSQSFPLETKRRPKMSQYGIYGSDQIFRTEDVEDLIQYAKLRGVRVIIEIDAPSHSGNGWQWGPEEGLGNLTVCYEQQPWRSFCIEPPCGQLNPVNPNVFKVLKDIYADIVDYLPQEEVFHMGGDEIFIPCWNSTQEILDYLKDKPLTMDTFLDLWGDYQSKATKTFDGVVGNENTTMIVWTSHLTDPLVIQKYLPSNRYVIQTWVPASDPLPSSLIDLGYRIIVSTKDAWYLDHGFWGSTTFHDWRTVYNNRIPTTGVIGGEVCMWAEYVDNFGVELKAWPRAAAAAERLWTNPDTTSNAAETRFYRHRVRLLERGIDAEALVPKWCYQNEGQCD